MFGFDFAKMAETMEQRADLAATRQTQMIAYLEQTVILLRDIRTTLNAMAEREW